MSSENLSRRAIVKLMVLAGPGLVSSSMFGDTGKVATTKESKLHTPSGRLRLFYNADSLKHIRRMLAADPAMSHALELKGEELLKADFFPEKVAEAGGGQQAHYILPATQVSDMGLTMGLLFHLTGEQKYAAKLRDALLYYGNYVRWAGPELIERIPPWHSELDTTTFSVGYSAGYDALHDFLSDADRQTIADTMVRLAVEPILNDWILPGKRIHSLDSMGHNWWGVCVAGGGLCALALLGDDPRAQSWIDAVNAGYVEWFNYPGSILQNRTRTFEPSGPSYEGVGYTNYGVSHYLLYRFAWQNTFPGHKPPVIEPLEHLATFFLQTLYPTSPGFLTVNFGDCTLESYSTVSMLLLIACGLGTPEAARYLDLVHDPSYDTLRALLHPYPRPAAQTSLPTACIYPHMGWAILRSSWQRDATMLAMKSGYTWNHAHADAGSFILFKQGKPLIIDSGTCSYSRPEYSTYYRTSRAHNVILFNGQGQPHDDLNLGCKFSGQIPSLIDGLGLKYVYADATGPMARWFTRNYRHWIWSGDVVLVIDDVRAHVSGEMTWLLHYDGDYAAIPGGGVRLKNGPAEVIVKMLYPANTVGTEMGLADHDPDKKIPYLVFHPDAPAQISQWMTAICLNPAAVPKFSMQEFPDYLHLRITSNDGLEDIYLNRRSIAGPGTECIQVDGFTTDAYLLHVQRASREAPVSRYFIVDGSYLRHGGRSMMESLSKLNLCWSSQRTLKIFSDKALSSVQLGTSFPPTDVFLNDQSLSASGYEYNAHTGLVSLKMF